MTARTGESPGGSAFDLEAARSLLKAALKMKDDLGATAEELSFIDALAAACDEIERLQAIIGVENTIDALHAMRPPVSDEQILRAWYGPTSDMVDAFMLGTAHLGDRSRVGRIRALFEGTGE